LDDESVFVVCNVEGHGLPRPLDLLVEVSNTLIGDKRQNTEQRLLDSMGVSNIGT